MATLVIGYPPAFEPSIARHINPVQGALLAPLKPVLPKMTSSSITLVRPSKPAGAPWRFLWWESARSG